LLILRYIRPQLVFSDKLMKVAFWWMNIGLALMLFTSLLPVGIIQFVASASEGLWYARSESFMQSDLLVTLRWIRTFGDVVFIVGALAVSWQVVKGLLNRNTVTGAHVINSLTDAKPEEQVCCGSCGKSNHL
jgi:nitric oxide reductase subunit B